LNRTDAPYLFHGYEVSYFTAKVRPALRYKGLWVDERRADMGEILRRTGQGFIPIVITPDDETWQDSTDIFDRLEARHPEPPLFPSLAERPLQRMAAHLVELYADEFALIPAMQTRWGSELGESSTRARFVAMTGSEEFGANATERMKQARYALGAADDAREAIDAHLREALDALSAHFRASSYLLGERMGFGDCALMGPVDGHFFTDLVSRRLLLETAPPVVGWIERTRYPNEDGQGAWLPDDALAPTLVEALRVMGRDTAPVLLDTVRAVEAWADQRPADLAEPPRAVGPCETSIRGTKITRGAFPYALFSLQRVLDMWRNLGDGDRAKVEKVVAGGGWDEVFAYTPRHRLKRDGFRIVFDD
jgi:glutathione S-transferase